MSSRPWFEEGVYRDTLQAKIDQDCFFVLLPYESPAKVIKLVYAGYKVRYPTGKEEIVNLTNANTTVQEITADEYQALVGPYLAREEAFKQQQEEAKQQALLEKQRIQVLQQSCLHEEIYIADSVEAAGYSSEDYHCKACNKFLRRSASTAYDNDPNDIIGDWNWYVRYCKKQYNGWEPKRENYDILEN